MIFYFGTRSNLGGIWIENDGKLEWFEYKYNTKTPDNTKISNKNLIFLCYQGNN